jgi:hypothetical protein
MTECPPIFHDVFRLRVYFCLILRVTLGATVGPLQTPRQTPRRKAWKNMTECPPSVSVD